MCEDVEAWWWGTYLSVAEEVRVEGRSGDKVEKGGQDRS